MSGARRNRAGRLSLSLAILVAAVALACAAIAPAAGARPLLTGVTNIGGVDPLAFERTRGSGARYVRIPVFWGAVAPAERPAGWSPEDPSSPSYDWAVTDAAVTGALRAGLTPVLQVDGAPLWAQRCTSPPSLPTAICDPDPRALQAFATAAARRFDGSFGGLPRVRHWQALNEPNLSTYFFPQFETSGKALSAGLYRDLVNAFYAGVKAVAGSNLVLAAGLGPIANPPWTIGPMRFARELLCMRGRKRPRPTPGNCEGGVHFDIFAIQPYTTGGPTHEGHANDVQIGSLAKLQKLIRAAYEAGRIKGGSRRTPLWITEFSWDSKPPDPGGLPMRTLTRWTAEALHEAWLAGIDHFFWYSLRDDARDLERPYSQTLESGLYFRGATLAQDRPKRVLAAFRFPFVAYPGRRGLSFWGRTPNSKSGRVAIQVLEGKRWRKALVTRANQAGIFHGTVRSNYGRDRHGSARARFAKASSVPFSMRPVADFRHPPFG